jgi:hypothetical protein
MVPHQRTSGYRSGSMSASAMMRRMPLRPVIQSRPIPFQRFGRPCGACQWVERTNLKSVNLSSETYGFERRPVTSLGYAPPRRRPAQRNDVRRGCRRSPCSAKAPSNAVQLRLRSRDPGRRRSPLQTFLPRLPIAYGRYWPGAAFAKCHLWLGLACDRLNGL